MSLKKRLAEFDASRKRSPEVVAILRRGIDYTRESGAAGLRIGSGRRTSPSRTSGEGR